jgi:hypothetical protein
MLGRTKVTTKFVISHESNFTVISNFEMTVTSKIFQIHIWHFVHIHFWCVAAHTPNFNEIREGKAENGTSVCWFDMGWLACYGYPPVECKWITHSHLWTWHQMGEVWQSSSLFTIHLYPACTAPLRGYTSYQYDRLSGVRVSGGTAYLLETAYIPVWFDCKVPHKLLLFIYDVPHIYNL